MAISAALVYKDSTLCVSQLPYCTRAVPFSSPSRPAVQSYPSRALVIKGRGILVSQQPFLYNFSILRVSLQSDCKRAVPNGYPSSPTLYGAYLMDIPAALMFNDSTLSVSQQTHCTRTVLYWYSSSPTVQGQYSMGSQQHYCTRSVKYG